MNLKAYTSYLIPHFLKSNSHEKISENISFNINGAHDPILHVKTEFTCKINIAETLLHASCEAEINELKKFFPRTFCLKETQNSIKKLVALLDEVQSKSKWMSKGYYDFYEELKAKNKDEEHWWLCDSASRMVKNHEYEVRQYKESLFCRKTPIIFEIMQNLYFADMMCIKNNKTPQCSCCGHEL